MLAGATGMDVALLVVAADDSVKPQTREHLEILRLLDLKAGVIALTFVEFGIRESEPTLYWIMFTAVLVMNTAFAIDAYQAAKTLEDRPAAVRV